ncbi:MAG: hypothetical protein IPK97_20565 [Ahniella sp.]|nr:hypothetical protein [Ahniella sp.]
MTRLLAAGSTLLAAGMLAACSGGQAPTDRVEAEWPERLAEVLEDNDGLPKPELVLEWSGQPFLADAEEACLLRRDPETNTRQFVLTFLREPDDALVLYVPEQASAEGEHQVERGWLVLETEFRAVWPSALMDVRIDPLDDGWLLDGRFELDLDGPSPADATPARIEGRFSRLFCLDLERLKAATTGPASTSP